MDDLAQFTTDQLRAALARAWSTQAAEELLAELRARGDA